MVRTYNLGQWPLAKCLAPSLPIKQNSKPNLLSRGIVDLISNLIPEDPILFCSLSKIMYWILKIGVSNICAQWYSGGNE